MLIIWIHIEIDKMSIREIKLDDIAVISQFIKPMNPIIVITAYTVEIWGIKTHWKFLKIINKTIIINIIDSKIKWLHL